ncbi:MAG: hypothetical protein GF390_03825 [Candidatus Pacebacteria bacterium]|nr:hypothetical protein [Candidatus Paceibacterota bacterium]
MLHGAPSEPYFPAYIILLLLPIAYVLSQWQKPSWYAGLALVSTVGLINIYSIFKHNFFVSNYQDFSYGPSVAEQQAAVEFIVKQSQGNFQFKTTQQRGKFASFFDNLRLLALAQGYQENRLGGQLFYLEKLHQQPRLRFLNLPLVQKAQLKTLEIYYVP